MAWGDLSVCGFDLSTAPIDAKRRLAYIPDEPEHFHDLTVMQHLAFTARVYAVPDAESKARGLLERFGLSDKAGSRAGDLSRGMRQKLAICCGYLHNPKAILFDRASNGTRTLTVFERSSSRSSERARDGAAIIVSSHLLAMVEDICTHVLILHDGPPTVSRYVGTSQVGVCGG